ncbi:MAG: hypothetical protein H0X26_04465 [Alphaproteobacteria bacterium]|nr:hypothetical protein [Alphaproteobacteria bacterium]
MRLYQKSSLITLGLLLVTTICLAQECPKTVQGHNEGGYTAEVIYFDCHGIKHTDYLNAGQTKTFASGTTPADGVSLRTWPSGSNIWLGSFPVPPEGVSFKCTGVAPESTIALSLGEKGKCVPIGKFSP